MTQCDVEHQRDQQARCISTSIFTPSDEAA
jgi:hypothetical protein